jgi:hypothetical protein
MCACRAIARAMGRITVRVMVMTVATTVMARVRAKATRTTEPRHDGGRAAAAGEGKGLRSFKLVRSRWLIHNGLVRNHLE